MSDLMLDVDQVGELKAAFRRNGWNNAQVKKLSEGGLLAEILKVINGQAEIKMLDYVINCDAPPFIPNGWSVEEHGVNGQKGPWKWNPNIGLYISKKQKKGVVAGNNLRKELAGKLVLNANALDYLLAHPELIPESWKGKAVFFWGTIYRSADGHLSVRYLYWSGSEWSWHYYWLDNDFNASIPAALAS
jgi:hypothetical protein